MFGFTVGSTSPAVGHEKSMSIMNRIPQLESKDCICFQFLELFPQLWIEQGSKGKVWSSLYLVGRESELVKTILPGDSAKHLQVPANKPGPRCHDHLSRFLGNICGLFVLNEDISLVGLP